MLDLIKIATLSAALSAGIVSAYGNPARDLQAGAKAFYDRLPQAEGTRHGGLLPIVLVPPRHAA